MQNSKSRDRAYRRIVRIKTEDETRFRNWATNLPDRCDLWRISSNSSQVSFSVRLKKEELLYIELAFNTDISKPKKKKKKSISLASIFSG